MAVRRLRYGAVLFATSWLVLALGTGESQAQSKRRSADGPNQITPTDVAAGQVVDSLFTGKSGQKSPRFRTPTRKIAQSRRPTPLTGKLVRNPEASDGSSPFALVDRYGGVLRYVEPVDTFDLEDHLGETVIVRHDAGDVLLASQLDFPDPTNITTPEGNIRFDANVQVADFEEQLAEPGEPTPSGEESIITPTPEEGSVDERSHKEGAVYSEGMPYMDEGAQYCGCPQCGSMTCGSAVCGGCAPGARGIVYARVEYLHWWFDGFNIPALVVEGESEDDPNGNPIFVDAVVVYGNERILDDDRSGVRFLAGIWLDDCGVCGIEGDYTSFDTETEQFIDGGDGVTLPFVGRPFIDATTGLPASQDVSFPGIRGDVIVDSSSDFDMAGLRFRHNICCGGGGGCDCGDPVGCGVGVGCGSGVCGGRGAQYVDFLIGVRWARLTESLVITEDLETFDPNSTSPVPPTLDEIFGQDRFFTENEFVGGEVGFVWEWQQQRWSLELLSLIAIGNNRQTVDISGFTESDDDFKDGLLLTQITNIGTYQRDEFTVIPQVGLTAGYQITPRVRLTGGYTLVYWGNVVRPGDQIDLEVNPELLEFPPVLDPDVARPRFAFNETDFWAHGLSIGGEMRW